MSMSEIIQRYLELQRKESKEKDEFYPDEKKKGVWYQVKKGGESK